MDATRNHVSKIGKLKGMLAALIKHQVVAHCMAVLWCSWVRLLVRTGYYACYVRLIVAADYADECLLFVR